MAERDKVVPTERKGVTGEPLGGGKMKNSAWDIRSFKLPQDRWEEIHTKQGDTHLRSHRTRRGPDSEGQEVSMRGTGWVCSRARS